MNTKTAIKDNAFMAAIILNKAATSYRPTLWNDAKSNWETISSHNDLDLYTKAVNKAEQMNGGKLASGQMVKFETKSGFQFQVWAD